MELTQSERESLNWAAGHAIFGHDPKMNFFGEHDLVVGIESVLDLGLTIHFGAQAGQPVAGIYKGTRMSALVTGETINEAFCQAVVEFDRKYIGAMRSGL